MVPERRARLEALLAGADEDPLRFFDDAEKLLAAALELGLEGIVSKKRDQPYRSGKNLGWTKVKTAACARRTASGGDCLSGKCCSRNVTTTPEHIHPSHNTAPAVGGKPFGPEAVKRMTTA